MVSRLKVAIRGGGSIQVFIFCGNPLKKKKKETTTKGFGVLEKERNFWSFEAHLKSSPKKSKGFLLVSVLFFDEG